MCVYVHKNTCVYIHVYILYMYTYMHVHKNTCVYIHVYILYMYTHIYTVKHRYRTIFGVHSNIVL